MLQACCVSGCLREGGVERGEISRDEAVSEVGLVEPGEVMTSGWPWIRWEQGCQGGALKVDTGWGLKGPCFPG